jgi:predicted metal-dependent hydrolase
MSALPSWNDSVLRRPSSEDTRSFLLGEVERLASVIEILTDLAKAHRAVGLGQSAQTIIDQVNQIRQTKTMMGGRAADMPRVMGGR